LNLHHTVLNFVISTVGTLFKLCNFIGADSGARYRALLDEGGKKDKGEELQVSWGIDLQAKADQRAAESRRKAAGLGELTPFEELMKKKREKSREKKLERIQKIQKVINKIIS
jgi:hypothetical protein